MLRPLTNATLQYKKALAAAAAGGEGRQPAAVQEEEGDEAEEDGAVAGPAAAGAAVAAAAGDGGAGARAAAALAAAAAAADADPARCARLRVSLVACEGLVFAGSAAGGGGAAAAGRPYVRYTPPGRPGSAYVSACREGPDPSYDESAEWGLARGQPADAALLETCLEVGAGGCLDVSPVPDVPMTVHASAWARHFESGNAC